MFVANLSTKLHNNVCHSSNIIKLVSKISIKVVIKIKPVYKPSIMDV